mgnify:CR=1 FL=1
MGVSDRQISRRSMIAKTAAVSAAVWAAPVIDSVVSAASAVSGCVGGASTTGSFMYVVFTSGGLTYYSGYSRGNTGSQCTGGDYPSANGKNPPISVACGSVCYTMGNGAAGSPPPVTYGPTLDTGSPCTPTSSPTAATLITSTSSPHPCSYYLNLVGNGTTETVTPATPGVTVVAAFCFGGGSIDAQCSSPTGCAALTCV